MSHIAGRSVSRRFVRLTADADVFAVQLGGKELDYRPVVVRSAVGE
jgi:hypothetical protein